MRRLLILALLPALLALPPAASADVFGALSLASEGPVELPDGEAPVQQALYAHDPAVSADGRYVVFDGYFGGRSGVWRRELQPPYAIVPVAVGPQAPGSESCLEGSPCDAELPSVSAEGRYVSFTTTARLEPALDHNDGPDVYVRDMDVPEGTPCAEEESLHPASPCPFELASAVNGGTQGLTYEDGGASGYGAVADGRSAISADGSEVAFVTTAPSDLAAPGTPAMQVAVRDLPTGRTTLVSSEYDPQTGQALPGRPVSESEGGTVFGAVYSPQATPPAFPFDNRAYDLPPTVGASISADGTAVAWMGRAVGRQARMLPGEHVDATYAEPLWRRIDEGPLVPTRRVTGGSQPEDPACAESGESSLASGLAGQSAADPCQGPFAVEPRYGVWAGTSGDAVPQLSADGETVAFLASAQLISLGLDFGRSSEGEADDLYVATMREGLARTQALRPLTELASGHEGEPGPDAPIVDFAISPDGSQVAFTTQRTSFPLATPTLVSETEPAPGLAELYDADLSDETLTRVTAGYEGGPSERPHHPVKTGEADPYPLRTDGALSPSFTADGNTIAFSSTASNLVFGDGNTPASEAGSGSGDGSDVFIATRESFPPRSTETYVSEAPSTPVVNPEWELSVTSHTLPDGRVRLYVEVPGEGMLSASARGAVPSAAVPVRGRDSTRARRASSSRRTVLARVAGAQRWIDSPSGGLYELILTPAAPYRRLDRAPGRLAARATVSFTAYAEPLLRVALPVLFRDSVPAAAAARQRTDGHHAAGHR